MSSDKICILVVEFLVKVLDDVDMQIIYGNNTHSLNGLFFSPSFYSLLLLLCDQITFSKCTLLCLHPHYFRFINKAMSQCCLFTCSFSLSSFTTIFISFLCFLFSSSLYGDNHRKWHVSGGLVLGANETREFIIRSLGATRSGG